MIEGETGITSDEGRVLEAIVNSSLISFLYFQVDSAKPFGENISEHHLRRCRRKSKFSDFPFPMRRGT